MNLARADTYINVYLPRPDGEDPRRYVNPASPIFDEEKKFRFSDQIQKDRPLFMGKKQLSLYEIYYKDSKGYVSLEKPKLHNERSMFEKGGECEDENKENDEGEDGEKQSELPSLKKVSLSLDAKIKQRYTRPYKMRFNEPLNSYVSNRKRVQSLTRFDPNSSLERQVTSYDYAYNSYTRDSREKTVYDYAPTTDNVPYQRLYKKAQSAPSDIRQIRSLGLPPISVSSSRRSSRVPAVMLPIKQVEDSIRVLPVRPSTKPPKVWRQTTDILTDRYMSKFARIPKSRYLTQQPVDLTVTSEGVLKSS